MPISKDTPTSDIIHDFVHSKDPKFKGKSKKERIRMALGASYGMKKEDAPAVNTSGVAGIGVGPQGEPGVSPKVQKKRYGKIRSPLLFPDMIKRTVPNLVKEETFAGAVVFEVSSSVFHAAKLEKRKGKHWRKYLEEDDCLAEIREYANKNPHKPIVLRNENTGEMCYARYGRKG
jgi:hypothetical protein